MKVKKNSLAIMQVVVILLLPAFIWGQSQPQAQPQTATTKVVKSQIMLTARNYGDSIVLRFAPNKPSCWKLANKVGYQVYRVHYAADGSLERKELLTPVPLKPLSKAEMINRYKDEKHPYGMVATQFLYGEVDLNVEGYTDLFSQIKNKNEEQNMRFAYCLQAADFDPDVADALGLRYVFYPKNDSKLIYSFEVHCATQDETIIPGFYRIRKDDVYENKNYPRNVRGLSIDDGVRLFWDKGAYTAYFIERGTDGKNFAPVNKEPFITSHMEENEVKKIAINPIQLPGTDSILPPKRFIKEVRSYEIFTDNLPNEDRVYYYRVRGVDAFGEYSKYSEVISVKREFVDLSSLYPSNVKVTRITKGNYKISWDKSPNKDVVGYVILMKHNLGDEEKKIHKGVLPAYATSFIYSGVEEGDFNMYTVAAIDKKGKMHKPFAQNTYEADTTPPAAPTGLEASFDKSGMGLIVWNANKEKDVVGYKVYMRYGDDEDWMQITKLPLKEPYLFDARQLKSLTRKLYYTVVAVDKSDNHSDYAEPFEVILPDIVPPVAPLLVNYKLFENKLKIDYMESPSNDVKAYNFYKKIKGGEWELVRVYKPSEFVDKKIKITVDSIAHNVNYSFVFEAEDEAGMAQTSRELPIILRGLEPEDVEISLSAKVNSKNKTVDLSWKPITLKKHKEFYYVLYRKQEGGNWRSLASFNQSLGTGKDYKVKSGVSYEYKIAVFVSGVDLGQSQPIKVEVK